MTSKEWVRNELSLPDYCLTTFDRIMLNKVLKDLDRLEELEKAQDLEIEKLKFNDNENKYQVAIRVLKEAFIVLGKSDITNTCWFKYLEELEKENKELREDKKALIKNADCCMWKDCINITKENEKLKKAIKFLAEQLGLDVDLENHNLITDDGTIAFVNADKETMSVLELLKEVIG